MTTWYLIADASRAKLLERKEDGQILLLRSFDHPDSRAHDGDLTGDLGRTRQTGSAAYASEREERSGRRHTEYIRFANELGEALKLGAIQNVYQELVLVSSPNFLGVLRKHLHAKVEERLVATLNKDLTELSDRELLQRRDVFGAEASM